MPELVSVTYDLRNADDELKMLFRAMLETDRVHNYLLSWYGDEEDEKEIDLENLSPLECFYAGMEAYDLEHGKPYEDGKTTNDRQKPCG